MMNTYIQVYKNRSKYSKPFLFICLVFSLIGIAGLLMTYIYNKSLIPFFNESGYFVLLFNGVIWIYILKDSMRKSKYFVSWDDSEINYLLPKSEKTESIRIENINSLKINKSGIVIELKDNEIRHFNLNYFFFPERQMIIDFFEEINKKLKQTF